MQKFLYFKDGKWHECNLHDNGKVTVNGEYIGYMIPKKSEVNNRTYYMMVVINGWQYTLRPDTRC